MPQWGTSKEYPKHIFSHFIRIHILSAAMYKHCNSSVGFSFLVINYWTVALFGKTISFLFSPENRVWYFMQIISYFMQIISIRKNCLTEKHKKIFLNFLPSMLTLKAPITTAADDILKFFFFNFSKKTSLDISCESSAWQTIHMKYQDLFFFFFWKIKKIKINVVCYKFCLAL